MCRRGCRWSRRASPLALLLVTLDRCYGPQRCIVGVHPGVAAGATLTQQVPALVEGDLAWAFDMAAVGQPIQPHVSARLKRSG